MDMFEASNKIKNDGIKVHLFMGGWCPMCENALPEIMSLFKELRLTDENTYVHEVNETKTEPAKELQKYDVKRIPAIVLTKNNNVIGKIIEYPYKSWREDILDILKN